MVMFALAYGSFGDIVETAKLAKQIIDVLRSTGVSTERQKIISTLQVMAQYMSMVSTIEVDASSPNVQFLATKLAAEVALCRALLDKFCARIKLLDGFIGRIWMAVQEEKESASWKTQVSERRDALYLLLVLLYGERSVDQLGRVESQVQYVGSRVDSIEAQVRLVMSRMSLHDISDPVFVVMDPLGRNITIQLSHCNNFNDLDHILKGFIRDPQAGGRYVARGDYSLVSAESKTILPANFARELRAGIQFDMSIIKRSRRLRYPRAWQHLMVQQCPHCHCSNSDTAEGSWINCSNLTCGKRYQVSNGGVHDIEEISSPQISNSQQEDQKEVFRLIQIVYGITWPPFQEIPEPPQQEIEIPPQEPPIPFIPPFFEEETPEFFEGEQEPFFKGEIITIPILEDEVDSDSSGLDTCAPDSSGHYEEEASNEDVPDEGEVSNEEEM